MKKIELLQELDQLERDWLEQKMLFRTKYQLLSDKKYPPTQQSIKRSSIILFWGVLLLELPIIIFTSIIFTIGNSNNTIHGIILIILGIALVPMFLYIDYESTTNHQKHIQGIEDFEQAKKELLEKIKTAE